MIEFVIKQIDLSTHEITCLHLLNLPSFLEPGFYRQITSWSSFQHNRHKIKVKPFEICASLKEDYERSEKVWEATRLKRGIPPDKQVPTYTYSSVWDFYKAIGWDYKKKRYIRSDK